jgi:hypothetical protein
MRFPVFESIPYLTGDRDFVPDRIAARAPNAANFASGFSANISPPEAIEPRPYRAQQPTSNPGTNPANSTQSGFSRDTDPVITILPT